MTVKRTFSTFVADLKSAGMSIRGEETLVARLEKSNDPEVELVKIASNDRASGVSFQAHPDLDEKRVVKAFQSVGFDGFAYQGFMQIVKP